VTHIELPATPERVWRAIRAAPRAEMERVIIAVGTHLGATEEPQ